LSAGEARAALANVGRNEVAGPGPSPLWRRVLEQVRDPLILVLLAATALTLATGDLTDAVIIVVVVVVNTTVGVAQELRADRAIAALSALTAPVAHVRRDGAVADVPAAEVVPGDIVLLGEGDIVPADATLLEAAQLLVDESALTGESDAVTKSVRADPSLSAGTVVVRGRATAAISATGSASALGRIAMLVGKRPPPTPLQRRLTQLGRWLALGAAGCAAVVFVVGLSRGQDVELMAVTAASLVVAAVPESLPAVVTLALALGARRMARHHAIVRRLPAVETLGSVTVVATDKTGTLTEGRMAVAWLWTPVTGRSKAGSGVTSAEAALLRAAALCNDARLTAVVGKDPADWEGIGDPTETALLRAAAQAGWHRDLLEDALPRTAERPFESIRRTMTTVHAVVNGHLLVVKGAPDTVIDEHRLTDDAKVVAAARAEADALSADAFRVLAIAEGDVVQPIPEMELDRVPLHLLGLVALADPVRASAGDTFREFRHAGIRPVVITGDHPETAVAVARRAGLETRMGVDLHARATPEQKLQIIDAMRREGAIVAMTGDGVNDAPALRRADIGVAMGVRGTEVARQAADLVLADDELHTLVVAVEEGRRAYDNVRRFLLFGLAGGVAELGVMVFGPLFGMTLPLLPAQILWINLLTHGLPGVAMGAEPADPDVLLRPPRPASEPILGAGLWRRILVSSFVTTVLTLTVGAWLKHGGGEWRTSTFLTLGALQFGVAAGVRARLFTRRNVLLPAAIALSAALMVLAVYVPLLQDLLGTHAVPALRLAELAALAIAAFATVRLTGHRAGAPTGR
jgi:Ca2+-transporting ATPase